MLCDTGSYNRCDIHPIDNCEHNSVVVPVNMASGGQYNVGSKKVISDVINDIVDRIMNAERTSLHLAFKD